jgi:hypothetical protein
MSILLCPMEAACKSQPPLLTLLSSCMCLSSQLLASAAEDEDTLYEEDEEEMSGSDSGCGDRGSAQQGRQQSTPAGAVPLKAAWRLFKLLKTATDRVVQSLLHVKRLLKVSSSAGHGCCSGVLHARNAVPSWVIMQLVCVMFLEVCQYRQCSTSLPCSLPSVTPGAQGRPRRRRWGKQWVGREGLKAGAQGTCCSPSGTCRTCTNWAWSTAPATWWPATSAHCSFTDITFCCIQLQP